MMDVKHNIVTLKDAWKLVKPSHLKILNDIEKLKPNSYEDILRFFDYDLIGTNKDVGGYCDYHNNIIAVNYEYLKTPNFCSIFSHEVSHIIQVKTDDIRLIDDSVLISDVVRLEQQCEAIAMLFHKKFFNTKYVNAYFSYKDIEYLINWGEGYYENDLVIQK